MWQVPGFRQMVEYLPRYIIYNNQECMCASSSCNEGENQCFRSVILIRIQIFSSLTFKMSTKSNFFLLSCLLFTYNESSKIREYKEINSLQKLRFSFFIFFPDDGRIRIRAKSYGSGNGRPKNLRIRESPGHCEKSQWTNND
jgi:hypothetical protein